MQDTGFSCLISDALANLYDPAKLQSHALLHELGITPLRGETSAEALRRTLYDAIESLRPPASLPPSRPEWLPYRVLSLHYLRSLSPEEVCQELAFSLSTFYRQRRKAVRAVVNLLSTQRVPASERLGKKGLAPADGTQQRTLQALASFPGEPASVLEIVEGVVHTLRPLARGHCVELRLCPLEKSAMCIAPDALRQILLGLLTDCIVPLQHSELEVEVSSEQDQLFVWVRTAAADFSRVQACIDASRSCFWRRLVEACRGRVRHYQGAGHTGIIVLNLPLSDVVYSILIVDDDDDTIALYRRYLESAGYLVHAAHDAAQARQAMQHRKPNLVLLDIIMPYQDGWNLLEEMASDSAMAAVPVIVCSVISQAPLARSLGAVDVLPKPISPEVLLDTVRKWLGETDSRAIPGLAMPAGNWRPRERS